MEETRKRLDEIEKDYGIDEEKMERMKQFGGSEGGRLNLPGIGETISVTFLDVPYIVNAETLKERGFSDEQIESVLNKLPADKKTGERKAWFIRVKEAGVEYDMPVSKTVWIQIRKEMEKNGFDMVTLPGRVFRITGREWIDAPAEYRRGGRKVKTYAVKYMGVDETVLVSPEEIEAEAEELDL